VHCNGDARLSPEILYRSIEQQFVSGELAKAEVASRNAATSIDARDTRWATRFRLQRAKIRIYQGHSQDALALLRPPLAGNEAALAATRGSLLAIAYHRSGDDAHAQQALDDAIRDCTDEPSRASLSLAQGIVDTENDRFAEGERDFRLSLAGARAHGDKFLETQALLNLGVAALRQEHYDDALAHFGQATSVARAIGARLALEKAAGALGSTLYKVGDYRAALASSQLAEEQAAALGSPIDQVAWLDDEGLSQFRLGDLAAAKSSYEQTLALAHILHDDEEDVEAGDALTALAWLALESGDNAGALARSHKALRLAARRNEPTAASQPGLVEALVLARQGSFSTAESKLLALEQTSSMKQSIHWQVEHALATLYADRGHAQPAEAWFRRAISTFQAQRSSISNLDSRLPFFENGSSLYLSYVEFLIREGRTNAALVMLDQSRAETLAEGLGVASAGGKDFSLSSAANAQALARQLHGTILVYCLRPRTSYLWAIGPARSGFFRLPGREAILPLVAAHTQAILAAKDVLAQPDGPGLALYRDLVSPAAALIAPHGRVFVIADDSLNALNFETLIPPGAEPHYWIEDADIINARSISLLTAGRAERQPGQASPRLLLVGDPVYDHPEDGRLAHAAEEVSRVAAHFSPERRLVLTGPQATPAAYLRSHPESFAYIHFVAHASASEIDPLDSSVILSAAPDKTGAYKLYARSILDQRLTADLVTISACYGSGVRSYSGEGLVGLAWAFLHTGSHQVIGALWEVSDASTPQLMGDLYDSLSAGSQPDIALRSAKLAMIRRGGVFRKPFYWAAFQLYSGA
jgi:CHAT domain-containing protein/Tfp pilus assembly protein PilF